MTARMGGNQPSRPKAAGSDYQLSISVLLRSEQVRLCVPILAECTFVTIDGPGA